MALYAHTKLKIPPIRLAIRGEALLTNPRYNKGTAFTLSERKAFGLTGRLPFGVNTLDEQCQRAYEQLSQRDSMIRKNTFMQSLKDQNWALYYSLLGRHLRELVPVIYTPTEADAIANYSHLFRRSEGLYLTYEDRDSMEEDFLEQTKGRDIDLIVCTDAEAILGIGDQGVGGIGISTAKSVIYTVVGGLNPANSLSVMLDVGTNNHDLLNDSLYVGWPHKRIREKEYDQFIDNFVQLVRKYYPHSLLHFEDFGVTNAHRLLDRYADCHAVFNDDIQGTGAVTLACVMAAIGVSDRTSPDGSKKGKLSDQRYVILGAGSAGRGIATQIRDAMVAADGISREEADKKFWMVDREGLLYQGDQSERQDFVRSKEEGWGTSAGSSDEDKGQKQSLQGGNKEIHLVDVVKRVKPTVLIGCSTAAGAFTEEVIQSMVAGLDDDSSSKVGQRPIIMPLSNPSRLVEALPEDLMKWTDGRALVATGSPFENVKMDVGGKSKEFEIAECNNALIYPGLGLGAIITKSRRMTDTMLLAGAQRLAALSPAIRNTSKDSGSTGTSGDNEYDGSALLPDFEEAPKVNLEVAVAVAEQAIKEGSASAEWAVGVDKENAIKECRGRVQESIWAPVYGEYLYDAHGVSS